MKQIVVTTRTMLMSCVFMVVTGFSGCKEKPVKNDPSEIEISVSPTSVSLTYGGDITDRQQITVTILPEDARSVTLIWSSDNNSVATVSQTGLITARGVGSAQITVKADDRSKDIPVEVKAASVVVEQPDNTIVYFDLKSYAATSYDVGDPIKTLNLWDDLHTVATLQGIVNRNEPRLFINYVIDPPGREIDTYWWNKYGANAGGWLQGRKVVTLHTVEELIEHYRDDIAGAVVYDSKVASTSNVASAVAGIESLVAIRYDDTRSQSLYSRLVLGGPKLDVKVWLVGQDGEPMFTGATSGSVKADPYLWFIENYMKTGKCNTQYGAYYIDQKWREMPRGFDDKGNPGSWRTNLHTLTNHDFFVSRKAFFFDLSPWDDEVTDDPSQPQGTDRAVLKELLHEAYLKNGGQKMCYIGGFPPWAFKYTEQAGGKHRGNPTDNQGVLAEWEYTKIISAYNAFKDADAISYSALANASFWQHFPLDASYPQKWVTHDDLKRDGYLTADGKVDLRGRDFFIFYVGDYDGSAWVSQILPLMWDNANRGNVPLMWCISPVLQERVPMALHHYRKTATANDYFASSNNGAGYLLPGMLQAPRGISGLPDGLNAWATHCKKYYDKWGLTITGFIIDGDATVPALTDKGFDCYASFSPNGIVPQKTPQSKTTMLHDNMPVLKSIEGIAMQAGTPAERVDLATQVINRINGRNVPFHWFRTVLKDPAWHKNLYDEIQKQNPNVVLLDAPTFFELYRIWLKENQ